MPKSLPSPLAGDFVSNHADAVIFELFGVNNT